MSTIVIKIDSKLFQDIHLRSAEKGQNLQSYMTSLIEQDLYPERFSQKLSEQLAMIKQSMAELAEKSAQIDSLIAHLDMGAVAPTQQECPSALDSLKHPLPLQTAEKKPKHRKQEAR